MTELRAIGGSDDEEVIEHFENMLEKAKRGEIRWAVTLTSQRTDRGEIVCRDEGGRIDMPTALFAFECWKAAGIRETEQ